ncbi:hypothetical protein N2152v2_003786 [Parachlorella kessleri]
MEEFFIYVFLLAVTCLVGHLLHVARVHWLTEGALALLVGLTAGGTVYFYYESHRGQHIPQKLFSFDKEVFFDIALPIIIFNAGFSVKKKLFFQNFLTLVLFGVVGTFMQTAAIATGSYFTLGAVDVGGENQFADSLALGAIFSSSDSIATLQMLDQEATPLLYSLVFGEGVVNDATSIVLLRAIQRIHGLPQLSGATLGEIVANFSQLFIFSLLLGVGMGLLSAYIIKQAFFKHSTDREVTLVALLGFLAFLVAEKLSLSGIFAVFFAGITMSHYTWHSLSPSAKVVTVYLFRILSFITELFLFIYAGFGMWNTRLWHGGIYSKGEILGKAGLLATALVFQVFLSRGAVLLVLVVVANSWRPRGLKIGLRNAAVIWWAGSARGAVTVALAYHRFAGASNEGDVGLQNQMLVVASMAVVVFTTVALGAVTGPLLDALIGTAAEDEGAAALTASVASVRREDSLSLQRPLLGNGWKYLQRLGTWDRRSYIHFWWNQLDGGFLQPLFGGRKPAPDGYRSPPPSPGRQTMYNVLAPHVLKRYTPAPCDCENGGEGGADGEAGNGTHPGPEGPLGTELPPGSPAVGDYTPHDSLEGLFTLRSSKRDAAAEEQLELQLCDEERFGHDAYLAAGAPDEPPEAATDPAAAANPRRLASQTGSIGRRSSRRVGAGALWPTPFDKPEDEGRGEEGG